MHSRMKNCKCSENCHRQPSYSVRDFTRVV